MRSINLANQTIMVSFSFLSLILAAGVATSAAIAAECPDFAKYATVNQGNPSSGPLALPFMRPDPACRLFNSSAVEKVIQEMNARLRDPDLARLFENTFPNTLDTTVKYFNATENVAFIVTGDITAQWLRDTANQFAHYAALLPLDSNLSALVKAIINTESRYVAAYPYCGAFQPPPESGLNTSHNEYAELVTVYPPVDNTTVFECKYEIDSLSGFVKLSRTYYQKTGDSSFINNNWLAAMDEIFRVMDEQSQSSFNDDWEWVAYYSFTGQTGSTQPPVFNKGYGEPKLYTGMVGTHHRPSDDLSTFAYLTSANAMMSVEMTHLANMLDEVGLGANLSTLARNWSTTIKDAIYRYALDERGVFAYETNGMGGKFFMDDANVPSLMSLPYLGFLDKEDPNYLATKKVLLSRENSYYAKGKNFSGIGGPHVNAWSPWPMGHASVIFGTNDDQEILDSLNLMMNSTSGLGLIHEAVDIYNGSSYKRPWFAWANSYFAEAVLDIAARKPYLIFKDNASYVPGI